MGNENVGVPIPGTFEYYWLHNQQFLENGGVSKGYAALIWSNCLNATGIAITDLLSEKMKVTLESASPEKKG